MNTTQLDAFGVEIEPRMVRFERVLPGPAERIWSYLTDSEKRKLWLASGDMEAREGGAASLKFRHSDFTDEAAPDHYAEINEKGYVSQHRITSWDPPRHLGFTWPGENGAESEVTFELLPEGSSVRIIVTHSRLADHGEMANVASGWHAHLEVLEGILAGNSGNRFWTRISVLHPEYTRRFSTQD